MRYLVRARVKPSADQSLLQAIEQRTLGKGSVAGGKYLRNIQDARLCAHDRGQCRDQNGSEPWACENCDCTERLERKLATLGDPFLKTLRGG
jgi:hypothetical protein